LPHLWPTGSSWDGSLDYGPVFLRKPFGFYLTIDTLSSGCLTTELKLRCIPLAVSSVSGFVPYLGFSLSALPGQRGVTPAFGYSTPHPGARGTLTLLISALPSAHYGMIRPLHGHRYFPPSWASLIGFSLIIP